MAKKFPRKEIYVYTSRIPLSEGKVIALKDREFSIEEQLREYSEKRWEQDNKGWTSSVIPTVMEVEHDENSMVLHCGVTEYKYLLGMVKFTDEKEETGLVETIHGLSTEIMPLTPENVFPLERRAKSTTQHGVGFYDIPNAGQNAQMWIDKLPAEHSKLVNGLFDMFGFPKWSLMRNLGLKQEEIGNIFYTGFSRGFEVSLDSQFNGYARINPEASEVSKRKENSEKLFLFYRLEDLPAVLDSIGNDGKNKRIKEDIFGNVPQPTEDGFRIIDDCLGTLLSNTLHLKGERNYRQALEVLMGRGYLINEINGTSTNLSGLN